MQQLEFNQYITPDGETYRFDTNTDKFLLSETGYGMPPIEYITTRGPFQHGDTVVDYRLGTRVIQLVHRRNACSRTDYWTGRSTLLDMLRPNRQQIGYVTPGVLRKQLPDGSQRDLNVFIEEGPQFAPRDISRWDEYGFTETLRFVAHDPVFYDPTPFTVGFTLVSLNQLVLPFTLPFILDPSGINTTVNTTYTGTWITYPTITIIGPLYGPIISNDTTGEKLQMAYNISNGETVTITTAYGSKSVVNQAGNNLIGTLTSDSDLGTFHIAPAPEAAGGVNVLHATGSNAIIGTTAVVVTGYTKYIGI